MNGVCILAYQGKPTYHLHQAATTYLLESEYTVTHGTFTKKCVPTCRTHNDLLKRKHVSEVIIIYGDNMAIVTPDFAGGELDLFKELKDIQVVFDVGARTDIEYTKIKPDIELHAFEPNPEFFALLQEQLEGRPKTYLNNFGLGDVEGVFKYNDGLQMFVGGEGKVESGAKELPIKRLDDYVVEKGITHIDFLKIDTEGYDFKVLQGGTEAIKLCRYIQYEHWDNKEQFHVLLEEDFHMTYIGGRNVFCQRK